MGVVGVAAAAQECAGSPPLKTLPASLALTSVCTHTRKHTNTGARTHAQTDRLYGRGWGGVKGHSHPAGCSLDVWLSVLSDLASLLRCLQI